MSYASPLVSSRFSSARFSLLPSLFLLLLSFSFSLLLFASKDPLDSSVVDVIRGVLVVFSPLYISLSLALLLYRGLVSCLDFDFYDPRTDFTISSISRAFYWHRYGDEVAAVKLALEPRTRTSKMMRIIQCINGMILSGLIPIRSRGCLVLTICCFDH